MKTGTMNSKTAIVASLAARKKVKQSAADRVVTDGVVCYYDAGVLLIVPIEDVTASPDPLQQGMSGVSAQPSA